MGAICFGNLDNWAEIFLFFFAKFCGEKKFVAGCSSCILSLFSLTPRFNFQLCDFLKRILRPDCIAALDLCDVMTKTIDFLRPDAAKIRAETTHTEQVIWLALIEIDYNWFSQNSQSNMRNTLNSNEHTLSVLFVLLGNSVEFPQKRRSCVTRSDETFADPGHVTLWH